MKSLNQFISESVKVKVGQTYEIYHAYSAKDSELFVKAKIVNIIKRPGGHDLVVYKYKGREFQVNADIFAKRIVK